ncbi:phospholipid scramblase 1-like [Babylonia areolata]|uniref:phospholipid scramblase 1-like n=1 Tax=Babylonia areolata TaxID=304850 RepID=UPI003FD5A23C
MAESNVVIKSQPQSLSNGSNEKEGLQTTNSSPANAGNTEKTESFPGSSILQQLDKLEVVQKLHALEVCMGWARNNRYSIYNEEGEQLFYVYEASVCFHRQLTGALRGLALKVSLSHLGREQEDVLVLRRPGACSTRCCWACCNLQRMEIQALLSSGGGGGGGGGGEGEEEVGEEEGSRSLLASMEERWSCCIPDYHLTDAKGEVLWRVRGGACHCRCCCCVMQFQFLSRDGEEVASISRSCQGCKEIIGAANRYTIHFSENLAPQEKLIILGGSFLVDLNYFEKQNKCW